MLGVNITTMSLFSDVIRRGLGVTPSNVSASYLGGRSKVRFPDSVANAIGVLYTVGAFTVQLRCIRNDKWRMGRFRISLAAIRALR